MTQAVPTLLIPRRRHALLDELVREVGLGSKLAALVAVMTGGAALYGAVLGTWRGEAQVAYAAVKLPLVLLVTSGLTMLFNYATAVSFGLRVRFAQVAVLSFLVLAVAALVLGSLAPVVLFFTFSAPAPTLEARTTHNLLYLLHTAVVALSGLTGMQVQWATLRRLAGERRKARWIHAAWLTSFALVGGEVAWALRPFVGSIYYPVAFLREDALDGNVYEFIWTDILPYLLSVR